MTSWLLAAIAVAVWLMALETVVYAAVRLHRWNRERRQTIALARALVAAQQAQTKPEPEPATPVYMSPTPLPKAEK